MRVLVVSHLYPNEQTPILGSFVADQVSALRDANVDVTVVNPKPWVPPLVKFTSPRYRYLAEHQRTPREVDGVRIEPTIYAAIPRNRLFWLGGPTLAHSLARTPFLKNAHQSFDLVHAHVVLPDGFGAVKWAQRNGLPVVCTAHGNDINIDPYFNWLTLAQTKWTIRTADAMIAVSNALRQRMLQLERPRRTRVIPSGIDLNVFHPVPRDTAREQLGIPLDKSVVLFVGSLLPVKGVQYLMGALARVLQHVPNSSLVLIGEGPLRNDLQASAARLGISASITFAGRQERALIPRWMAAADLLVLPSENEGMPLVVLEAMASGLPVVASDIGGIGEALGEPAAGLLTPVGDELALSAAMIQLLTDSHYRRQLGERGRARAQSFSWTLNAEKTVALYNEVLFDSRRAPSHRQMFVVVA